EYMSERKVSSRYRLKCSSSSQQIKFLPNLKSNFNFSSRGRLPSPHNPANNSWSQAFPFKSRNFGFSSSSVCQSYSAPPSLKIRSSCLVIRFSIIQFLSQKHSLANNRAFHSTLVAQNGCSAHFDSSSVSV